MKKLVYTYVAWGIINIDFGFFNKRKTDDYIILLVWVYVYFSDDSFCERLHYPKINVKENPQEYGIFKVFFRS